MGEISSSSASSMSRSNSPSLSGWVELNSNEYLRVVFLGVRQLYSSSEDIRVFFRFIPFGEYSNGDIIALAPFRGDVGSYSGSEQGNSIKLCCSFDANIAEDDVGKQKKLVVPSASLPKKTEFYQFLYMRNGIVIGTSGAFFLQVSLDDLLSVSSEDDFLVVHQSEVSEEAVESPEPECNQGEEAKQATMPDDVETTKSSAEKEKAEVKDPLPDVEKTEVQQVEGNRSPITSSSSECSSVTSNECSTCVSDDSAESNPGSQSSVGRKKLAKYWGSKWHEQMSQMEPSCSSEPHRGIQEKDKPKIHEWFLKMREELAEKKVTDGFYYAKASSTLPDSGQDQTIKAMQCVIERTMKKYESARKQMAVQAEANRSLMEELKEQDEKLKSLTVALEKEKKSRDMSRKEILTLSCEKNILEMELREKGEKVKSLEESIESMKKTKEVTKAEFWDMITVNEGLKSEVSKLNALLDEEQKMKQVLKEQVSNLSKENDLIQAQLSQKGSDSGYDLDASNMLLALEASKCLAIGEMKSLQSEREKLSDTIQKMTDERGLLQSQIENMKQSIQQHEEQTAQMRAASVQESLLKQKMEDGNLPTAGDFEEMHRRLSEAAELYKKQYLEIMSLRKNMKKLQKRLEKSNDCSCRKNSTASSMSAGSASASDPFFVRTDHPLDVNNPIFVASANQITQTPELLVDNDDLQCLLHLRKNDSDTGEFIKVFEASANAEEEKFASIQVISLDSLSSGILSASDASTVPVGLFSQELMAGAACAQDSDSARSRNCATQSLHSSVSSTVNDDLSRQSSITAELVPDHTALQRSNAISQSYIDAFEVANSVTEESIPTSVVKCHYCEIEIALYGDDTMPLVQHLHSVHEQLICPICSVAYNANLPIEYFQMHVESHFEDETRHDANSMTWMA